MAWVSTRAAGEMTKPFNRGSTLYSWNTMCILPLLLDVYLLDRGLGFNAHWVVVHKASPSSGYGGVQDSSSEHRCRGKSLFV